MTLEDAFRQPSDALMHALDRLREIEEEKRSVPPADPRFAALAGEVERFADEVLRQSRRRGRMADEAPARVAQGQLDGLTEPIEEAPSRDLHIILEEWREAERRLAAATPGSPEEQSAIADAFRLREEYVRAHGAAQHPGHDEGQAAN